jgi:glycyl-tRNA synthetase beta chain
MFALGLQPTGSKDPFALRRQANGIVRTIAEHKLPLRTSDLFELAVETFKGSAAEAKFKHDFSPQAAIGKFFRERLEFYLREQLGYAYDTVNAVLASGYDDVVLTVSRADAVSKMRHSADFESICAAFKRINNILQQAYASGTSTATLDSNRFVQPEENELFEKMRNANTAFLRLSSQGHYLEALTELSRLRQPIDKFFDKVLVMAPEEAIRANRIALLETLENGFSAIADFSEIVTEGKA